MRRWYDLALKLSATSLHDYQMAAVIVSGGRVLACGVNARQVGGHAELRAIHNKGDFRGATIYVARRGGKMSRPCDKCWAVIREVGIERMVYANWAGELVTERVI